VSGTRFAELARLSRGRLWAIAGLSAAFAVALVPLLATSDPLVDKGLWIAMDVVIGAGFTGVGLFAWHRRPDNPVGALMVATAFTWYLAAAAETEPSLLWTVGTLLDQVFVAVAIHLLLAFPSGRLRSRFDRVLVAVAYLATTLGWWPVVLFSVPEWIDCVDCPTNLALIDSNPSFATTWGDGLSVVGISILATVFVRLVQRWRGASAAQRRAVFPVFAAGGVLMLALSCVLVAGLLDQSTQGATMTLFNFCLIALGLVPYLFLAALIRGRWIRVRGVGALVSRLGEAAGEGGLRAELASALGDPSLELAYWLPKPGQYVDHEGRPVELPGPETGRAVTEVDREGRRIAAIVHDPALLDDVEQVRAAAAAAGLALENERLDAELRAKVEELRASRARLVEVGLLQRRRLERDLHDGAQQRLVSLALTLRLAQERIDRDPRGADELLSRSREELDEALTELRELARGIHPAILTDRGIGAAAEALARRAPLPVELGEFPADRAPEHIEVAAYYVIAEALTNVAKYSSASRAAVAVTRDNGQLVVEVRDDGVGGADPKRGSGLRGLAARVEAIEGRLDIESEPGRGTTVRARIPCG
jgi:signal transduction histidine kinase